MFENQLLNLNIYSNELNESPVVGQISTDKMTPKLSSTHAVSIESLNSGGSGTGGNIKRRQLPQIPFDKQKENRDKSTYSPTILNFLQFILSKIS